MGTVSSGAHSNNIQTRENPKTHQVEPF